MRVQSLSVGPIVGYTRQKAVRLWGRGQLHGDPSAPQRCFGVVRLFKKGTGQTVASKYFKMLPKFDFTGYVEVDSLRPDSEYAFQMGYVLAEMEPDQLPDANSLDWSEASEGEVKTTPPASDSAVSFVFGSCRYNLREDPDYDPTGEYLEDPSIRDKPPSGYRDTSADKVFRTIREQIERGVRTDFLLMVGDQIYADELNILFPARHLWEYYARYVDVFGQPHMRALMSRLPTYMILDDHEIMDDWNRDRLNREKYRRRYHNAMRAYESYQLVHGPAFQPKFQPNRSDKPTKLWYQYDVGAARFFVLDTRTERTRKLQPPEIISDRQMRELKDWLVRKPQAVKFVVTSVPFFPDPKKNAEDKWAGFPEQRFEVLDFIRTRKVRRVVFLSGDVHLSAWAALDCPTDPSFRVHSVISSPFYWPYWHESEKDFVTRGVLNGSGSHPYRVRASGWYENNDNFVRVTMTDGDAKLLLELYDRKGARLKSKRLTL